MVERRRVGAVIAPLLLFCVSALAGPAPTRVRMKQRDAAEEARFARELRTIDPDLPDLFTKATADLDQGHTGEARKTFEAIALRAPKHAATLRRLSYSLKELGEIDAALDVARRARDAEPGPWGDFAVASVLVAKKGAPAALEEAGLLADKLLQGPPNEELAAMAGAIAMERQSIDQLGRAVAVLERVAPNALATNFMAAVYDGAKGQSGAAEAALSKAIAAGLPPEVAQDFREKTGLARRAALFGAARAAGMALLVWLLGFGIIFVVGRVMSDRALAAIERLAPDRSDALVCETLGLRKAYARAIAFAAGYYYVSIPIVIALVLLVGAALVLGMLALGWIPIKLLAIVVIVALVSVSALLRSLFARRRIEPEPGPRLDEVEAPDLWAVLREVAAQVQTRPVDNVFLSPGTEVGVFERGTMSERLRDRGRRHLVLGVGVLDGLTERQLRAILAHEYGHFAHRDTARGDLAGTVRTSLVSAVIRLAKGGGVVALNPAWLFLRFFCALFERIALGASRLQEALADRFAATSYGGSALIAGLRHVARRSVEFDSAAAAMISAAQGSRRPLASLYVAPPTGSVSPTDVEGAVAKVMTNPGSPYDSHPPIAKRIAWLESFGESQLKPTVPTSDGPAWDLIPNRAAVEAKMTAVVNQRLEAAGHIDSEPAVAPFSPLNLRAPDRGPREGG